MKRSQLINFFLFSRTVRYGIPISFFLFLYVWTYPFFSEGGTIKIYDRSNTLLYEQAGTIGTKHPVPYTAFPDRLIQAVVATEDAQYFTHWGVNIPRIASALISNIQAGKIVSGASTIPQQVVRFSVIAPGRTPKRTVIRKIREVLMAIRLSATYSKNEILSKYLNGIYFGNRSYGIQAAAKSYFDKDVRMLSLSEIALLIGLISSPEARNPYTSLSRAKEGQEMVLSRMVQQHLISASEKERAINEPLVFYTKSDVTVAPHAVSYILDQLRTLDVSQKRGLAVYTTLDASSISLAESVARQWIRSINDDHDVSNAALVAVENKTGALRVMLGGVDYTDSTHSGQVNMATALRQPGSALKPVTYAAAFASGKTAATQIYDVPTVYKTKKGEGYAPNNYDGRFHGIVLAREALASSLNLPAVSLLSHIGLPMFLKTARSMGISTFTDEDRYDLSITLGGGEVTLLDLTTVYATLARGGAFLPTYVIDRIEDDTGKIVYSHTPSPPTPVFGSNSQAISFIITDILSDPKARMLGFSEKNPLVLSRPAAAKTGTTTDWHDNWTMGYTPTISVGVWVGNTDNHPMRNITGVVGAAPIWHQFLEELLQGSPVETFEPPENITDREICATDGMLPGDFCPLRKIERFIRGTQPTTVSPLFAPIAIDIRNGLRASSACPKQFVEKQVFMEYPQELYAWALSNDMPSAPKEYSKLCDGGKLHEAASFVRILYPVEKSVFELAPELLMRQGIVFESAFSSDIVHVSWMVDGIGVGTISKAPFTYPWTPTVGKHTVSAIGMTANGTTVKSNTVALSVLEYTGSAH